MKLLAWIMLLSVTSVYAQEVIESAPLSVEDDGTRKIVVRPKSEAAEGLSPAPAVDGQLKLDAAGAVTPVATPEKKVESSEVIKVEDAIVTPPAPKTDIIAVAYYEDTLKKYLQFSFGYINSRYEKIHSALDNGSLQNAFRFAADITPRLQSGLAIEVLSDTSGQTIPDNIRVLQYRLFVDYHAPLIKEAVRLDWVAGASFSVGDFGIRRRFLNAQGEEVSLKLKSGTIVGLIPAAGFRGYLWGQNSFDLVVEYYQYFGNPQKYIGGFGLSPRLNLEF